MFDGLLFQVMLFCGLLRKIRLGEMYCLCGFLNVVMHLDGFAMNSQIGLAMDYAGLKKVG